MSRDDRARAPSRDGESLLRDGEAIRDRSAFLRRFIMAEVLAPPLALRRQGSSRRFATCPRQGRKG